MKAIWLFRFTSYSYCQGTRDRQEDLRLLTFTLPCDAKEAEHHLISKLKQNRIEFDEKSIECLNFNITNS